jgi:hypothetical protein
MVRMALLPSPAALIDFTRDAVGQVVETAAAVATVPVRVLGLLGQTELLVNRVTLLAERAEALIDRVDGVVDGAEGTLRETRVLVAAAALAVDEAGAIAVRAGRAVDGASAIVTDAAAVAGAAAGVVEQAEAASAEARELLDGYAPTLRQAAPLAARFVSELTPEEVTAAIRMVDELPRLRQHLSEDVMPLLGKLDQVGPDLHALLAVTNDLYLAIVGLPGLKRLRRRGEERLADEETR